MAEDHAVDVRPCFRLMGCGLDNNRSSSNNSNDISFGVASESCSAVVSAVLVPGLALAVTSYGNCGCLAPATATAAAPALSSCELLLLLLLLSPPTAPAPAPAAAAAPFALLLPLLLLQLLLLLHQAEICWQDHASEER